MAFRALPRFFFVSAFALALALPSFLRAAERADLEKRFLEANAKIEAGDFKPALEIYNEILEAEPDAGNVWVMRAVAKWNLQDRSGARADLAQAIKLHPDNIDAFRVRARMRYEAKDFLPALEDLNRAVELHEAQGRETEVDGKPGGLDNSNQQKLTGAELYGLRGEVKKQLGDSDGAIGDLTKALEFRPDYAAFYYTRGQLYESVGDPAAALADYTRLLELEPKHVDALNNRGWLHFYALEWDNAITDGRKALELRPKFASALRIIGFSLFGKGDYAEAALTLAAAAEADPKAEGYALLVRHHALLRTGGADDRLATSFASWKDQAWLQALARFTTGAITEDELETAAHQDADETERASRTCEMHFYIGLARRQAGDKSTARLRFQSTIAANQKDFVENALAQAELERSK